MADRVLVDCADAGGELHYVVAEVLGFEAHVIQPGAHNVL